jgi:hypothetical protein
MFLYEPLEDEPLEHVEVRRVFDAPINEVWARYTDWVSWTRWAQLGKVHLDPPGSPDPDGVGAVRRITDLGITVWEEVLSFEPPRRMTYRVKRGGLPMRDHLGEVVLVEQGARTLLIWRSRFRSGLYCLGPAYQVLITWLFGRALEGLAADLQRK